MWNLKYETNELIYKTETDGTDLENKLTVIKGESGCRARLIAILWLLCPWDSPGKDTGVGCHFLLQRGDGGGIN